MGKVLITGITGFRINQKYDWDDLYGLYTCQRLSQNQIARLKGCCQATVSFNLKYYNIESRPSGSATGEHNPFFRRKHSEKTKQLIGTANTGNISRRGKKQPQTTGGKNPAKRPEVRLKISQNRKGISTGNGELNINWKGGVSFEPYTREFRKSQPAILARDIFTCRICGGQKCLGVHHKDLDKKNSNRDNLITLCASCHTKLHWANHTKRAVLL